MATTTNYGWTTPDDTGLVKDGASAIRSLGTAIDSSMLPLRGGSANQVLVKNSSTQMDFGWATPSSGGMTSIASGSLSGTSVVLSSIPSTYNMLILEVKDYYPSLNGYGLDVQITGTTSGYKGAYWGYNGSSNVTGSILDNSFSRDVTYATKNSDNNNYLRVEFYNYTSAYPKVAKAYGVNYTNGNVYWNIQENSYVNVTAAISSLTLTWEGGAVSFSGGTYTLWGVK